MTVNQEGALKEFLDNITEPFSLSDVVAFVRMIDPKRSGRLSMEISSFIESRNIAFHLGTNRWVSRRGCFEPVRFVISPTRLELLNGILIPGHRCVPFANPDLLPQKYTFTWKGQPIPMTTTEGPPDEFYPYYSIYGEEYAPQYVARDNPENESAFNYDPYEDPVEVSIQTLDMRNIYREAAFVPGDCFVAQTLDWKNGSFELERVAKDAWSQAELYDWFEAAEGGFEDSFEFLGPGTSTEEQIAYAYWFGGKRMREVPAYSLETFLYDKTDRIETVAYGIETRFWYAGKEIPDRKDLEGIQSLPDKTVLEEILYKNKVPISEYVIQAYVWDSLYRNDIQVPHIFNRIIPPSVNLDKQSQDYLGEYITDALEDFQKMYSPFADQTTGPLRQRVGELHTAVIDLAARIYKSDIDVSWLPRHTFVILSQIQGHAASVLEDLDLEPEPDPEWALTATELEAMDNSLDSMIETYEDIKELIEDALDSFRRNNISMVKGPRKGLRMLEARTIQISIGGTEVWRRIIVPEAFRLKDLHLVIQTLFGWSGGMAFRFITGGNFHHRLSGETPEPNLESSIADLAAQGVSELIYEYGTRWNVKIMILSRIEGKAESPVRCSAGAGAAPPENVAGPARFRKLLSALEQGNGPEHRSALDELGQNFDPQAFDLELSNRNLAAGIVQIKNSEV
ncbi:plasmid pRiA4b ORF-3 family protein [Treponema sp. TIM-1]|uniref:plasmid pRiA4b ORF-3 family protein n=1 Tax=Treponema sp. TIM-1 TaxID=2898417 RepID=UPI00397F3709